MKSPFKFVHHRNADQLFTATEEDGGWRISWESNEDTKVGYLYDHSNVENNIAEGVWLIVEDPPKLEPSKIVLTLESLASGETITAKRDGAKVRITYANGDNSWWQPETIADFIRTGNFRVVAVTLEDDLEKYVEAILARE